MKQQIFTENVQMTVYCRFSNEEIKTTVEHVHSESWKFAQLLKLTTITVLEDWFLQQNNYHKNISRRKNVQNIGVGGGCAGGSTPPQKFWFDENPGKIP